MKIPEGTTKDDMSSSGERRSSSSSTRSVSTGYNNISDLSIPIAKIPNKYLEMKLRNKIGIDIGGTLAKLVYFNDSTQCLDFKFIGTAEIENFIGLVNDIVTQKHNGQQQENASAATETVPQEPVEIHATGGGAYKFYDILVKKFGENVIQRKDEMESAINGLSFFMDYNDNLSDSGENKEVFTYNDTEGKKYVALDSETGKSEYGSRSNSRDTEVESQTNKSSNSILLVNIGSGVSIVKINRDTGEFERVGGSSLGGGSLWGILSLITGAKTYDEMLSLASKGDNTKVDMLVGDIYGTSYDNIGLKSTHIASSMGKTFQKKPGDGEDGSNFNNSDICKSMLYTVSNNIGQITYLQAKIHNIDAIFFGGSYIRGHLMTMNTLNYAINFWSKGSRNAYFLDHEAYLGAIGSIFI